MKFRKAMALLLAGTMGCPWQHAVAEAQAAHPTVHHPMQNPQIPQTALTAQMSHCP